MKISPRNIALVLAASALLAGCVSDEKLIVQPTASTVPLFQRYVALGNSITAGYQSGGINDSTQAEAYPILLAEMAGVPDPTFPAMAPPGCPAPYAQPFILSTARVGGFTGTCAPPYRINNAPNLQLNNVAVPGVTMLGLTNNLAPGSGANALTSFFLGGKTQAQAMIDEQPTFVTVWAGNNDALEAAVVGDTTLLTPLATFQSGLDALVAAMKQANPQGAVLIGVVNAVAFAPILQPGAYFWAASQAGQLPKPVSPTCAPMTATGAPNPSGFNFVSLAVLGDSAITTIDCAAGGAYVLNQAKLAVIQTRVQQFNAAISAAADANGWLFVDPTTALPSTVMADPNEIRKCQGILPPNTPTNPADFAAAVEATCPVPVSPYFGELISYDATHPSAAFHRDFAAALAQMINQKYNTSVSTTPPAAAVFAR